MFPKVVLHKRNGHRRAPETKDMSLAEMIRLVHSGREPEARPTFDLLKFANAVRSEKATALVDQAAREIDALQMGLAAMLAHTESDFAHGEMADVRADLESMRSHADLAARMMAKLVASAETRTADMRLVNLNDLLGRTLAMLRLRLGADFYVARHLEPELPAVAGNGSQLQQVLVAFVSHVWQLAAAAEPRAAVVVETARVPGVLRGEELVSLRLTLDGATLAPDVLAAVKDLDGSTPLLEGGALEVYLAAQILNEHGGTARAENFPEGLARITIEMPAV